MSLDVLIVIAGITGFIVLWIVIMFSFKFIGPTEIGLVTKNLSFKSLSNDNPIALKGEAGFQARLLMPGLRFKLWPIYTIEKFPWIQVPAGQIGVVISQVGNPLPYGAKSAVYKKEFGNFSKLSAFIDGGGEKGLQRPVLPPGTLAPIHPIGFIVITSERVYGVPIDPELSRIYRSKELLTFEDFGLTREQLNIVNIHPDGGQDIIGIVTAHDGMPLEEGDIANRLGGFLDVQKLEENNANDPEIVELVLGTKNKIHNNYQDFQGFIDNGGRIGLQHDPILYGSYNLNPFLISVEKVPMLVVEQGAVAVIKSYVGLVTKDTSGAEFKFGSIVHPGHRGIWQEPLRTGKYPINPRCYQAVIVPTSILTLNWADAVSEAHDLDHQLCQIIAKSKEGFVFKLDLQVQIHVSDIEAPRVISMVGTMKNLINEVLQAAVGNHFRDKMQSIQAIQFIEQRQQIQAEAESYIREKLNQYSVETRGVYIQDVILPEEIVNVLKEREIANQQIQTYEKQKEAEERRIEVEKNKGTADKQADLAASQVEITIKQNLALARKSEADGEATYISETGTARAAEVRATGLAKAEAYEKQVAALGKDLTAMVTVLNALAEGKLKLPDNIVLGGQGGSLDLFLSRMTHFFTQRMDTPVQTSVKDLTAPPKEEPKRESTKQESSDLGSDKQEKKTPKTGKQGPPSGPPAKG